MELILIEKTRNRKEERKWGKERERKESGSKEEGKEEGGRQREKRKGWEEGRKEGRGEKREGLRDRKEKHFCAFPNLHHQFSTFVEGCFILKIKITYAVSFYLICGNWSLIESRFIVRDIWSFNDDFWICLFFHHHQPL